LLSFSWQPELAQQCSHSLIELHIFEVEHSTEGVQYFQYLFIIFSKVLPQNCLIDSLQFYYVLGNGVRSVLVNEPLGDVIRNGVFWLFVEHENKVLRLFSKLLVLADVV
jgi:hypothetical protein